MQNNVDLIVTDILLAIHGASPGWLRLETPPRRCHGLIFVKEGRAKYSFTDGHSFTAGPGDLFFLPKFSRYQGRQVSETDYSFVYVDFETPQPEDVAALGLPEVFSPRDPTRVLAQLSKMASLWLIREPGYLIACRSILLEIIGNMVREHMAASLPTHKAARLEPALQHMRLHFSDHTLRMQALAERCYMSEVQFRRVFREVYGQSPASFLADMRISRAKDLLQGEYESISRVAEICGFASLYYFSRAFRRATGLSPSEYRAGTGASLLCTRKKTPEQP